MYCDDVLWQFEMYIYFRILDVIGVEVLIVVIPH